MSVILAKVGPVPGGTLTTTSVRSRPASCAKETRFHGSCRSSRSISCQVADRLAATG